MDRGYLNFERLYVLAQLLSFFVIRAKRNLNVQRIYSLPIDKSTGLQYNQAVMLITPKSLESYPDKLRRVKYLDAEKGKLLVFLTSNFLLPALTIAMLYKCRWQIEIFFKWIKQHLRIKSFYGTSANAVKTQIWAAISIYMLVAIVKKTPEFGPQPLHKFTDFQCNAVRKSFTYSTAYKLRFPKMRRKRRLQS
jgi:hypothetical protein